MNEFNHIAKNNAWLVIHNNNQLIAYIAVIAGQQTTTSNHTCEVYDNEAAAEARARELGWVPEVEE